MTFQRMSKWQKVIVVVLIVVIGLLLYVKIFYKDTNEQVTFFDVGQGDAALIRMATGEKILVDCGPNRKILSKLGRVLKFYDREIDYLIATHPDLDHYGGCVDVLRRYKVKKIVTNGISKDYDSYWQEWNKAVRSEGAEIVVMDGNAIWTFGSSTAEFFSPDKTLPLEVAPGDGNNYSIVFKLATPSSTYLFTGDMEIPLELALLNRYCNKSEIQNPKFETNPKLQNSNGQNRRLCPALAADILKVGHHGSDSSTSEDLLRAVAPEKVVVSAGRGNRYGHPSLRIIRRLERMGISVLRTDEKGDIIIE
ncbi:MAG: hypothetical protein UX39_C0004G0016 [Candidatus Magasanikbacteria bacterium GW2011_GWA2_46_17]|uniref:Metallo-beta-lactamase domain-containing protein n=1 Tax=Candidatus Magasanikbacteria bacterium GW2011_GWA2_46_17 TaxID=1619042 RepID=A0A0G1RAV2_9BACT|nr:MAG: hypothetical protein UX39_C0004G0016 [Candidatus Magasanikbacteria bacterium GW2011_GWA2_46_17]